MCVYMKTKNNYIYIYIGSTEFMMMMMMMMMVVIIIILSQRNNTDHKSK